MNKVIRYLCDRRACNKHCTSECKYTTNIEHAENFQMFNGEYIETNKKTDDISVLPKLKRPLIIGPKLYTVKIKLSSHLLIINDVVSHEMINGWCKIVDKYNRANYVKENLIEHLSCEYMPPFI